MPPNESRRRRWWIYLVEACTVLGLLLALVTWLLPHVTGDHQASSSSTAPTNPVTVVPGSTTAGPAQVSGTGNPGTGDPLDAVRPDEGAANLGPLPKPLAADPSYSHPLSIHCATNQTTDQFRRVRYLLLGRWSRLHATLRPYAPNPDESPVQVQVFLDDQKVADQTVKVGESADLDVTLDGAQKMEVRVVCLSSADTAILNDARIRHA